MSEDACIETHYGKQDKPLKHSPRFHWVEFNGTSSSINCGSDASLDNIWTGKAATVDFWVKLDAIPPNNTGDGVAGKGSALTGGWQFYFTTAAGVSRIYCTIISAGVDATLSYNYAGMAAWHHYAMTYDDLGDRTPHVAIDGAWVVGATTAATGALNNDAMERLYFGVVSMGYMDGDLSWFRGSDILRWTPGVDFVPPDKCAPPLVDANTVEQWALDEGSGATTAASVHSPANDGAMTNCTWHLCM